MNIQELNDDCLIHIFSFLSISDRVRCQRVCRQWKLVGDQAWRTLKVLTVSRDFWGFKDIKTSNHRRIFEHVVCLYGSSVTHVDLYNREGDYKRLERVIFIQSCKNIYKLIHQQCPRLRSIHAGCPVSESTILFIADYFTQLTHFTISMELYYYDGALKKLFFNNKNLKYVKLISCEIDGICFRSLNFDTIQELHLEYSTINQPQHLLEALKKCTALHTLSFEKCSLSKNLYVDSISLHLKNLKSFTIVFYDYFNEDISFDYMKNFQNLEKLSIQSPIEMDNEALMIIGNNCTKLKNVKISDSFKVTDEGIFYIISLPELRYLFLKNLLNITDASLSHIPKLKELECASCTKLSNKGLHKLIKNSEHLSAVRLLDCLKIQGYHFLYATINQKINKFTFVCNFNQPVLNQCLFILNKYGDSVTRVVERKCPIGDYRFFCDFLSENKDICSVCGYNIKYSQDMTVPSNFDMSTYDIDIDQMDFYIDNKVVE